MSMRECVCVYFSLLSLSVQTAQKRETKTMAKQESEKKSGALFT